MSNSSNWYIIASELASIVDSVEGVKKVHADVDWPYLEDELRDYLEEDPEGVINAWAISRTAIIQDQGQAPSGTWNRVHSYTLRGYMSRYHGSAQEFNTLVEEVLDILSPPRRLESVSEACIDNLPQANQITIKALAQGLPVVHYAEIQILIQELRSSFSC